MATIYMTLLGKRGLRELAEQNLSKAHYLADSLQSRGAERVFSGPFFNEFVIRPTTRTAREVNSIALAANIVGGLELGRFFPELEGTLLVCATETTKRADMDRYTECFGRIR